MSGPIGTGRGTRVGPWKIPDIPSPGLSEFWGCTQIPKEDPLPLAHQADKGGMRGEHCFGGARAQEGDLVPTLNLFATRPKSPL